MRKRKKLKKSINRDMKKESGVTITTMIIAVILLIILTAVSITALRNSDRDVLSTAYDAQESMAIASYEEELDIIEVQCFDKQLNQRFRCRRIY